jgi:hypothetical protein
MKITRTVMKPVEEITDVICNNCGGTCMQKLTHNLSDAYGLIEVEVQGGYASTHLSDMTAYKFSVCEKCLHEFFEGFVIKPDTRELC